MKRIVFPFCCFFLSHRINISVKWSVLCGKQRFTNSNKIKINKNTFANIWFSYFHIKKKIFSPKYKKINSFVSLIKAESVLSKRVKKIILFCERKMKGIQEFYLHNNFSLHNYLVLTVNSRMFQLNGIVHLI